MALPAQRLHPPAGVTAYVWPGKVGDHPGFTVAGKCVTPAVWTVPCCMGVPFGAPSFLAFCYLLAQPDLVVQVDPQIIGIAVIFGFVLITWGLLWSFSGRPWVYESAKKKSIVMWR